jgi:hypothetical protein
MRSQRGQATIDYVAIIAVLAAVLAAAVALATGRAPGIANAVVGQIRHALCIVTGGACPAQRQLPCVVASERNAQHVAATILLVRLDGDRWVLRERLSDDTVRLTLGHGAGAGVELGAGARAQIGHRGRMVGIDDEVRGSAQGVLRYGETYVASDDREADKIQHALRHRLPLIGGDGPDPTQRFFEGGTRGLGWLGIGGSAAGARLEGVTETIVGGRRDERSGNVTITLNAGSTGWGMLNSAIVAPSGSVDREVTFSLTLDRDHRPIELGLAASGSLAAGATLPTGLARRLGIRDGDDALAALRGRRWEIAARLDLADPAVAAAWTAFRHDPADRDAIGALASVLRTRAQLDARSYAVSSEAFSAAAGVAAGLRLGGEIDITKDRTRLLAAASRPPGGLWEQRVDCVPA